MEKIKDKFFDLIIILGLIFLIMQISIITADKKDEIKSSTESSVQNTPPAGDNNNHTIQDEADKPVSSEKGLSSSTIDL